MHYFTWKPELLWAIVGDYDNFYLLTNVILLVDVFENFRNVCLQHYGFDSAHNYTSPGLYWQAAPKMTDVEMDLLIDFDQNLFIEERISGGMATISHWYTQTNSPGMENYDVSKCISYKMYMDASNLFGWVISQPLPISNFKWLTDEEMEDLKVMMMPDDSSRGYILDCNLGKCYFYYLYISVYSIKCNVSFLCISRYPHELHDLHKDYPLATECLQMEENILSKNISVTYYNMKGSANLHPK